MTELIECILSAKRDAGDTAYLWLHTSGDCILWGDEASSEGDAGQRAIGRWHLTTDEVDSLIETGEVDDVA